MLSDTLKPLVQACRHIPSGPVIQVQVTITCGIPALPKCGYKHFAVLEVHSVATVLADFSYKGSEQEVQTYLCLAKH